MMNLIFEVVPDTCVEMGVFGGSSLFPTAYALKCIKHGVVFAIDAWDNQEAIKYYPLQSPHRDWWRGQNLELCYRTSLNMIRANQLEPYCIVLRQTFAAALGRIASIDILHIDATHTNEGDFIDAIPYIKKVRKMGYIWFDGWANSPDTYEYLKKICHIKKVIDSGNCILLQKLTEE